METTTQQTLAAPQFIIVGGVNGVGKSTFARILAVSVATREALADVAVLDPDEITREVLATRNLSLAAANLAALRQVRERIGGLIRERRTFISETVLANRAYLRLAGEAKSCGYHVRLLYVGLPTVEDALARIARRVSRGGHAVPEADVRRRWEPSHRNLAWFVAHADAVDVISNAAAGGPVKRVAAANGGALEIIDRTELPSVTAVLERL